MSRDVVRTDSDATSIEVIVDHAVAVLSDDEGVLRCQHGDRLMVLFGRGVAGFELAPRGAVL